MSSVLVKGMEMPESCIDCKIKQYDDYEDDCVCPFSGVVCLSIGRQDACPLVALPDKHGRLVDADEMLKRLQAWNTSDRIDKALYNFAWHRIMEQPTIVESEDSE